MQGSLWAEGKNVAEKPGTMRKMVNSGSFNWARRNKRAVAGKTLVKLVKCVPAPGWNAFVGH